MTHLKVLLSSLLLALTLVCGPVQAVTKIDAQYAEIVQALHKNAQEVLAGWLNIAGTAVQSEPAWFGEQSEAVMPFAAAVEKFAQGQAPTHEFPKLDALRLNLYIRILEEHKALMAMHLGLVDAEKVRVYVNELSAATKRAEKDYQKFKATLGGGE